MEECANRRRSANYRAAAVVVKVRVASHVSSGCATANVGHPATKIFLRRGGKQKAPSWKGWGPMKRHVTSSLLFPSQKMRGCYPRTLDAETTTNDAGYAEQTGAKQEQGTGLRNATAAIGAQHKCFAAQTAVAEVDAALPEVADRRTAGPTVREVPCFGTGMGSVIGVAQRQPVEVASSHRQRGNGNGDRVNVIAEAVAEEESAVRPVQGNRSGAEFGTEGAGADFIADRGRSKAAEEPQSERQSVGSGRCGGSKAVGDVLDTAKEVRSVRSSDEEAVVISINGAIVKDHCAGESCCAYRKA